MFFAATATSSSQSSSITTLLFPLLLVAGAYFLFIRPRSQQMKRAQAQSKDVSIGDRVMTTSGMLGRVVRVSDETVMLEIAPDIEVSFVRRAISRKLDESDPAAQEFGDSQPFADHPEFTNTPEFGETPEFGDHPEFGSTPVGHYESGDDLPGTAGGEGDGAPEGTKDEGEGPEPR